jgi:hypothetical protein
MSAITPDADWIRARRQLLSRLKHEVARRLGDEPDDVREFSVRYGRVLKKPFRVSSKAELLSALERSDLVFGGDFHAHGPSQRTHLKVLRALQGDRPVILALEAFASSTQKWLDQFINGKLTLDEVRRKTQWDRAWGFPWENYRPLLELAKRRGFKLLALNLVGGERAQASLEAREKHAARLIRGAYVGSPEALVYVIFGDLHLAPQHLPKQVRALLSNERLKTLTLFVNSEHIYFQLAKKGLELSVDVVRLAEDQFCILSSPPWVPWQSYLFFLEKTTEENLAFDDDDEDEDEVDGEFDATDHVISLVKLAASDLGFNLKVDDLSVYTTDDNRIWQYLERNLKNKELEMARSLVASGRSFFVPNGGVGFLSRSTVNHAAHLAGEYIHARVSRRRRPLWSIPGDFRALIWTEAVAFFISKLINHKRASETLHDLKTELTLGTPEVGAREAMKIALDWRMSELVFLHQSRRRGIHVRPRRKSSWHEAARILGGMMGERLYLAHRSRKLDLKDIHKLMKLDVTDRDFARHYEDIVRMIEGRAPQGGVASIKTRKERL